MASKRRSMFYQNNKPETTRASGGKNRPVRRGHVTGGGELADVEGVAGQVRGQSGAQEPRRCRRSGPRAGPTPTHMEPTPPAATEPNNDRRPASPTPRQTSEMYWTPASDVLVMQPSIWRSGSVDEESGLNELPCPIQGQASLRNPNSDVIRL
ncbi:hypothetical protein AAG570_002913 [Ranatra chinensis]|uniref:Uncharacterized protein n=1 Tax=Ranatra chinensis TaxID=642074 RepID=A0ABD0Y581_9HEMI